MPPQQGVKTYPLGVGHDKTHPLLELWSSQQFFSKC